MTSYFDVAVIGGGIAGVSAAANVAPTHSVVLLEQESELAHHTTSRSAAIYVESEGGPVFHRMSTASKPFFDESPGSDTPLLTSMPVLKVGDESTVEALTTEYEHGKEVTPTLRYVTGNELLELCPVLNPSVLTVGVYEDTAGSIDVMALHQLFLRTARSNGTEIRRSARLISASRRSHWHLETEAGPIEAGVIVNAAGAWGDVVAQSCGVEKLGLMPMRRTAFTAPIEHDPSDWPFIYSFTPELQCYFKPEAGNQLLCSLSEENLSDPVDARAAELDVAMAIDRIQTISTLTLRTVKTTWAGLRTFAPDRNPVFGWDDSVDGFLWMVGQGGCGIVTSPAAGQVAGALIRGEPLPNTVTDLGLTKQDLAPRPYFCDDFPTA